MGPPIRTTDKKKGDQSKIDRIGPKTHLSFNRQIPGISILKFGAFGGPVGPPIWTTDKKKGDQSKIDRIGPIRHT